MLSGKRKKDSLHQLSCTTDTLSGMLAQEVQLLSQSQPPGDPARIKALKEVTGVLKDLTGVAKALNEQGARLEAKQGGVVLLPAVELCDGEEAEE